MPLKKIQAGIASYMNARRALWALEVKEATLHLCKMGAKAVLLLIFFTAFYLFGLAGLVGIIPEWTPLQWPEVALCIAATHLLLFLIVILLLLKQKKTPLFKQSLHELQLDRQWLQQRKKSPDTNKNSAEN